MHTNALKRILKCIAPSDVEAYTLTGEKDQNGIEIWKPELHTCGVESLNSAQPNFVSSHTASKEFSTGCMLQGNAKRIISQQVALGEHEDLGTWDTRAAHRINRWAGHNNDGNMISLLTLAPHAVRSAQPIGPCGPFTPAHPCAPRALSLLSQPLPAESAP